MITWNNYANRELPQRKGVYGYLPWPDILSRAKRAIHDNELAVAKEVIATSKTGMEAVLCLTVTRHGLNYPNTAYCLCVVVPMPAYRKSSVIGGVVHEGVPCALFNYGSYRTASSYAQRSWGLQLDRIVTEFAVDIGRYGSIISKFKSHEIPREAADAIGYRMVAQGHINGADVQSAELVRPPSNETAWQYLATFNHMIGKRPPIILQPRLTQPESSAALTKEVLRACKLKCERRSNVLTANVCPD